MSVDSEWQRAGALIDAGRAAEALRILGPLLAAQPEDATSLRLVSMAHAKLGTQEKSLEAAAASTRVSPDNDLSWRLVAAAASALGRHDEATAAAERARAIGPGAWRNHYIVVMVAAGAHAPSETARVSVREVLRLAPLEPDAHFAAAYYSSAGADWPAAEQEYRKVLELDPSHAMAQNNLAAVLMRQKKLTAATSGLTRTLGTNPTLAIARENLFLAGRSVMFRLCLVAALAALLIWGTGLFEIDAREASVRASEGFQIVLAIALGVVIAAQAWVLHRALGARARGAVRQLAGDRAIRASTLLLVIACVLIVLDLALPSDPVKAASGPAILVAVIGAVAARAL